MDVDEEARDKFYSLVGPRLHRNLPWWPNPMDGFIGEVKFVEAIHLCNTVRFTLWDAFRLDHAEPEDEFELMWLRSLYWKNAVVWMNSWQDLMYQSIWLALDLHGIDKGSTGWYKEALRKFKHKEFMAALEQRPEIKRLVATYSGSSEAGQVRQWANHLKHHGVYDFVGLDLFQNSIGITWKKKGAIVWTDKDIMPEKLNLAESIAVVSGAHLKAVTVIKALGPMLFGDASE